MILGKDFLQFTKGGAVGGDGSGGKPPVRPKKGTVLAAVSAVSTEPGMSGRHYRSMISGAIGCSSETSRKLLQQATFEGFLEVVEDGKTKTYSVTASGEKAVQDVSF